MPKEFQVKAGERVQILWVWSSSLIDQARFRVEPINGGIVKGILEISRLHWITRKVERIDLCQHHIVDKTRFDGDWRIFVEPEQDCQVIFESHHLRAELFFKILAGVFVLGLISAIAVWTFIPPGSLPKN